MTQHTSNACSSHDSKSSDENETQKVPNAGMQMGSWRPQLHGVPPTATHGATPPYAPIASSSGVGTGLPDHAFQAGPGGHLPPPVADASGGTPQHPSVPFLYTTFPSAPFPTPPPFVAQASGSSVGKKRAADDLEERDAKRTKTTFSKVMDDPLFKPVLNQSGQFNGTYVCAKDGMVLCPESYRKHIKTRRHLGYKLVEFECPVCFRTFSRIDSCRRHYFDRLCGRLAAASGRPPPSFLASEASTSSSSNTSTISASGASTSSASDAPATVPAVPFTYAHPNPMFAASMPAVVDPKLGPSQPSETGVVAEPAADDEDEKDDTNF